MIPELIKIGPLTINSFGLMVMLAFLIPTFLMRNEMIRHKLDPDLANGVAIGAMIGGFLGSRIYFIFERWEIFFSDPANKWGVFAFVIFFLPALWLKKFLEKKEGDPVSAGVTALLSLIAVMFATIVIYINFIDVRSWSQFFNGRANYIFTGAGMVWYGGLLGGFLIVTWYVHQKNISIPLICDIVAPMLALGQVFGRMGCLLSGDGDYGPPTDLPWAMSFPNGVIPTNELVHPTPIYDMILLFIAFLILWGIRKKALPTGFKFSLYLILIGTERITTEFFRTTPKVFFGLTLAQLISIGLVIAGSLLMLNLSSKEKQVRNHGVNRSPQKSKLPKTI